MQKQFVFYHNIEKKVLDHIQENINLEDLFSTSSFLLQLMGGGKNIKCKTYVHLSKSGTS